MPNDLCYVVVEMSPAGDTVIGVFSSMAMAREAMPVHDTQRLIDNYRVELHVLDSPVEGEEPWRVSMDRSGAQFEVSHVVLCNCDADAEVLEHGSYIEAGGERVHLIVWAPTKGQALSTAELHRQWLIESRLWESNAEQVALESVSATVTLG